MPPNLRHLPLLLKLFHILGNSPTPSKLHGPRYCIWGMLHLRHALLHNMHSHTLWGPQHPFWNPWANIISGVMSVMVPLYKGVTWMRWGLQKVSQLQCNGGFGGVDGLHRIGRISEGVMTASRLVFISELIFRTSKEVGQGLWRSIAGFSVWRRNWKKEIPMHIGTIDCCCLQGRYPKSEWCSINSFSSVLRCNKENVSMIYTAWAISIQTVAFEKNHSVVAHQYLRYVI